MHGPLASFAAAEGALARGQLGGAGGSETTCKA
jgi:hypothetical protein